LFKIKEEEKRENPSYAYLVTRLYKMLRYWPGNFQLWGKEIGY
jgi:hypothetical protein